MPSKKKRIRRRQRRSKVLPALIAFFAAFAALLTVLLVLSDPLNPQKDGKRFLFPENPSFVEQENATPAPLVVQQVTPRPQAATPEPTLRPQQLEAEQGVIPAAVPFDYFLPVHNRANLTLNDALMIAVTIDDCDNAEVLDDMVSIARKYDAMLTLFPSGEALMTPGLTEGFRSCVKSMGFQLENAGFTVKNEYKLTDGELMLNIWKQSMAASYAMDGDYQQHFYRPANIKNANDQRTHFVAQKLGFYGIATYTHSYAGHNIDSLVGTLRSGNIYQFDMSLESLELFKLFVRAASEKGYQLVTMNKLFGYEENNLSSRLTIDQQTLPTMSDYTPSLFDLKVNDRAHAVIALQKKLIELGYLPETERADGVYGAQTSIAVSKFQADISLPAIGDADVETQQKLFAQ